MIRQRTVRQSTVRQSTVRQRTRISRFSTCLPLLLASLCGLAALLTPSRQGFCQARDKYATARKEMVSKFIKAAGVKNPRVLESMENTLRHEFVTSQYRSKAYLDMALPIGELQTISSPFIVAYMTESLEPSPTDKVLEIGTGSGYQAAILSPLVSEVYSIEIVPELGRRAARTLRRLRYRNVVTKIGDGFQGWKEHAPFDKIVVTCSPEKPPQPLVEQLREGGLMVIPVGERYQQTLYLLRKRQGKLVAEALRPTLFVPMTGRAEDARVVQPDPRNPKCLNGDFEAQVPKNGFAAGWYYQRQMKTKTDGAPRGKQYVEFENAEDGLAAHLLQGIPIDGSAISALRISAQARYENVIDGSRGQFAALAISFYDANRKELSFRHVARFRGESEWAKHSARIPVPAKATAAILRVGLFGATGKLAVDDVLLEPIDASK